MTKPGRLHFPPSLIMTMLCGIMLPQCTSQSSQPARISLDTSTTYQTMQGWGGHVYPQAYPFFAEAGFTEKMLDELKTTHLRVRSYWYRLEGENDNDDPAIIDWQALAAGDTGLVHDELLMQQALYNRGVKLMFAAWRFPFWMCGQSPDWRPSPDEKPELPAGLDAEFVESIAAYLLYARDRYGIVFDGVSVANEPDIGIYIQGIDPARLLHLTQALKERLNDAGYETQYYLPDVAAADSIGQAYTETFFQMA